MNKNSQSGFGVIEIILLLVVVAIVGFTGWRVYQANQEVSQTPVNNSTVEKQKTDTSQNTVTFTDKTLGVTFSYPKEWVKVTCPDHPESVFLGSDNRGVGMQDGKSILCGGGSDFPVQMSFTLMDKSSLNEDSSPTTFKIDGKAGKRYVNIMDEEGLYAKGFETTTYTVDTNGKVLVMSYNKWPASAGDSYDTSAESKQKFIDIVEKSLRFL